MPAIYTPGKQTSYANKGCYLASTKNCSESISREHYVSRSLLDILGEDLVIQGFPWQAPERKQTIRENALTAKVLCERHNASLSTLDTTGAAGFRAIINAAEHGLKKSLSERAAFFLASGDALERWALKSLLGAYYGKIARADGQIIRDSLELPVAKLAMMMLDGVIPPPLGMYVTRVVSPEPRRTIGFAPLISPELKRTCGLMVSVYGLEMAFAFDPEVMNPAFFAGNQFYRPTMIDFAGPKRTGRTVLTWLQRPEPPGGVVLEFQHDRLPA